MKGDNYERIDISKLISKLCQNSKGIYDNHHYEPRSRGRNRNTVRMTLLDHFCLHQIFGNLKTEEYKGFIDKLVNKMKNDFEVSRDDIKKLQKESKFVEDIKKKKQYRKPKQTYHNKKRGV